MSKREPYLGNPQATIAVLNKYGFTFQKKFGQNFLIDPHVLDKIIRAAEITEDDFVLEIGPGMGTMTQYLAYAAREVYAVEIDKSLIPILEDTLSDYDNVTVINEDILKVNIAKLAEEIAALVGCVIITVFLCLDHVDQQSCQIVGIGRSTDLIGNNGQIVMCLC